MFNGKSLTALLAVALLANAAVAQSTPVPETRPAPLPPATQFAAIDAEVAALLTEMGDTDAASSDRASQKLLAMGLTVLPSLGRAARSGDPQVRDRATSMLRRIPWDAPDDSANVKSLLHFFATRTIDQRRKVVQWLANMKGADRQAADHAMGRILMADPDYDVLWEVVTQIRLHPGNTPLGIGPIDIRLASGPVKVVGARAHEAREPAPSARLMLAALAEDARAKPRAQDRTEILMVVKDLIRLSRHSMNEANAAKVIRLEFPLTPPAQQPWLARELYALHADNDLPDFQDDLKKRPPDMSDPTTLYAFSRMERRHGNLWTADVLEQVAFHAVAWECQIKVENGHGGVPEARSKLGGELVHKGWHDQAKLELNDVLNSAPPQDMRDRVLACLGLSSIDRVTGDDRSLAEHLRLAIETWDKYPDPEVLHIQDQTMHLLADDKLNFFALMHWALLRQASKTHDLLECDHESLVLAALRPINDELLLDAYPHLIRNRRTAEAQALFDANYEFLKSNADVAAENPDLYARLAWACAECDQHLDEALQAANKANKLEPHKAVFLNTLAEVDFHRGEFNDAIQLEEQAWRLSPKDPLIIANLARDRAAATTQPAGK